MATVVVVPRGFYLEKIDPHATAEQIDVQADDYNNVVELQDRLTAFMTEKAGGENVVWLSSGASQIKRVNDSNRELSIMLTVVAGISLLVGGIGIMNIMLVTVTERKREIGICKALGAAPADIRNQFLTESACITIIGGLAGIGLGVSAIVLYVRSLPFTVQWQACFILFAFSVIVGLFFGIHPAMRAAALDPVDALAGE